MKIQYYKSVVCPRCWPVSYELEKLKKQNPELEIEYIEIFTNMGRTKADGVMGIPTLIMNGKLFTSHMPKGSEIRKFVMEQLQSTNK